MVFAAEKEGKWRLTGGGYVVEAALPSLLVADGRIVKAAPEDWTEARPEAAGESLTTESRGAFEGVDAEWHVVLECRTGCDSTALAELRLEIVNSGTEPLLVNSIDLFGGEGAVVVTEGLSQTHWLQGGWHMLEPWQVHSVAPGQWEGAWMLALINNCLPNTLVMGFADFRNCLAKFFFEIPSCPQTRLESLEAILHPGGTGAIAIAPGGRFTTEPLFLATGTQTQAVLGAYGDRLHRDRQRPIPQARWIGWDSYYNMNIEVTQEDVIAHADVIAERFLPQNAGNLFLTIDHGWQKCLGDWEGNDQFPKGMEWVANEIRSRGLVPGIWLNLFQITENCSLATAHPEWLLHTPDGERLRVGKWYDQEGVWDRFCLDVTHPEVRRHLVELMRKVTVDWGYHVLKIDFSYSAFGTSFADDPTEVQASFHDSSGTVMAAYLSLLEAMRGEMADEVFVFGCLEYLPSYQVWCDSMRVAFDGDYEWLKTVHAIRSVTTNSFFHTKTWLTDPDVLLLQPEPDTQHRFFADAFFGVREMAGASESAEPTRSLVQARVAATYAALSGGPIVSSDLLTDLPEERWAIMEKIIPPYGTAGGHPLDLTEQVPSMVALPIAANGEDWHLLAVYNWQKTIRDAAVRLEDLGLDTETAYHVFEFWAGQYQCVADGRLWVRDMAATSVGLYAIRPVAGVPQVVGNDRHYSQGAVEFSSMQWLEGEMRLELVLSEHIQQPFCLWIHRPAAFREARVDGLQEPEVVAPAIDGEIIRYRVAGIPSDRTVSVTFEKQDS